MHGLCQHNDVEGLGTLCKALNSLEMVMEIISLHVKLSEVLARILAFVEDFDCDAVGGFVICISRILMLIPFHR